MRLFYLLRHEDVHNNSGVGIVAEGVEFESGMCSMTWLSEFSTVTTFPSLFVVHRLHGHDGKTEVITEDEPQFKMCRELAEKKVKAIKEGQVAA